MADSKADAEAKALKSWYSKLLDQVVKEMIRLKAVTGEAVQAAPLWMVPNEVLLAKVWGVTKEHDFVWTLSVDKLIADYIAGSLAATPREAVRHFSMKWQMDADRLMNLKKKESNGEMSDERMQEFSNKLIGYAEALYDLTNRDEVWEEKSLFDD